MTLVEYIESRYGTHRGASAEFLRDNPMILAQELTRWKRTHHINLDTGEIYKPTRTVLLKPEL
ncbi:hypothetical protein [Vibrio agarivorans]|uniref:hypothetical protein n=1 Tax=Vibrio agarivorans TaxID=153622 RepID=UPI0025B5AD64|nr:hypothetical protein [Vibrio agarivorans]MDN3661149.1 hypothetical protein [Vibrio agarivorans]